MLTSRNAALTVDSIWEDPPRWNKNSWEKLQKSWICFFTSTQKLYSKSYKTISETLIWFIGLLHDAYWKKNKQEIYDLNFSRIYQWFFFYFLIKSFLVTKPEFYYKYSNYPWIDALCPDFDLFRRFLSFLFWQNTSDAVIKVSTKFFELPQNCPNSIHMYKYMYPNCINMYFRGKKISRILAKFTKINSFFDPRKCRFAKINSRKFFQNWWFAKINSREIFQKLMKCLLN